MKKVFIFLFIVNLCFAQNNNLKYEDLQNPEFYKTVKKGQRFDSYLDKNNNLVKVNDELGLTEKVSVVFLGNLRSQ